MHRLKCEFCDEIFNTDIDIINHQHKEHTNKLLEKSVNIKK